MPVIVLASPKGGVGKSTCAVLLATGFAYLGADVIALDCDPNASLTQWASRGLPEGITVLDGINEKNIVRTIRERDGEGRVVIVDLEGVASQTVSRAISQADLVIVPMQPMSLDATIGSRALALIRDEEEVLRRSIRHAVALTRTSAVKTRIQRILERDLEAAGIDVIQPSLVSRTAFSELFTFGHDLEHMAGQGITTTGNILAAIQNARAFTEAVYARLA